MSDKKSDKKIANKKEQKKDWKPIIIYICSQIASIIGTIVVIAVFSAIKMAQDENFDSKVFSNSNEALALTTSVSIACMAIVSVILLAMYRKRLKDDFKRLTKKQWGLSVLAAIAMLAMNTGLSLLLENLGAGMDNQDALAESMSAVLVPTAIMTAVFAPIVEELVFRYSLGSIVKNPIVFVIISSLIFAVLHATNIAIIVYLMLGLFFSLAYIKTDRNVVASIFLHFVNNLLGTIGLVLVVLGIE